MKQSDEVFGALKADILSLRIRPGAVLQELVIAQNFGVSRTPAREALHALMRDGLVVTQGRSYTVREFAPAEVRSLYELREGLEIMAVRLAVERATDAELAALEAAVLSAGGGEEMRDIHQLHLGLVRLTRNPILEEQLALILEKVTMISRIIEKSAEGEALTSTGDHARILHAVRRRSAAIAEAEMSLHIRSAAQLYERSCGAAKSEGG